ncbi:hypothetical protein BDA96_09G266400 [Sorghum bicolor]|uniref:Uncharacterized protein n=1 Tax=Sorghum bicolor TaxID=4558 RepID=A0A921U5E8_SORBI|nr:hypothetical protein BDA96_09G266400 [Sorghum bicolor]
MPHLGGSFTHTSISPHRKSPTPANLAVLFPTSARSMEHNQDPLAYNILGVGMKVLQGRVGGSPSPQHGALPPPPPPLSPHATELPPIPAAMGTPDAKLSPYVAIVCSSCFNSFIGMLQLNHVDVAKVDLGSLYMLLMLQAFLMHVASVLFEMFHLFLGILFQAF